LYSFSWDHPPIHVIPELLQIAPKKKMMAPKMKNRPPIPTQPSQQLSVLPVAPGKTEGNMLAMIIPVGRSEALGQPVRYPKTTQMMLMRRKRSAKR
jgi:hypothetical protein